MVFALSSPGRLYLITKVVPGLPFSNSLTSEIGLPYVLILSIVISVSPALNPFFSAGNPSYGSDIMV